MDFYSLNVAKNDLPKTGYAKLYFKHVGDKGTEYYDLSGDNISVSKFENWCYNEFGYLHYVISYH